MAEQTKSTLNQHNQTNKHNATCIDLQRQLRGGKLVADSNVRQVRLSSRLEEVRSRCKGRSGGSGEGDTTAARNRTRQDWLRSVHEREASRCACIPRARSGGGRTGGDQSEQGDGARRACGALGRAGSG